MTWLIQHEALLVGLITAIVLAVLQWLTPHRSEVSERWQWLLALLDQIAPAWNRGSAPQGLPLVRWLKMPGQLSPTPAATLRKKDGGGAVADALLALLGFCVLMICLWLVGACTPSDRTAAEKHLRNVAAVIDGTSAAADVMCAPIEAWCIRQKQSPCELMQKCQQARRVVAAGVDTSAAAVEGAHGVLDVAKQPTTDAKLAAAIAEALANAAKAQAMIAQWKAAVP